MGSKSEIIRKPVPRISTLNTKIKKIQSSIELKYYDTLGQFAVVGSPTTVTALNAMGLGTDPSDRIGNKVSATSIQIRGTIEADPTLAEPTIVRVIIFWDTQANGAAPNIIGNTSSGVSGVLEGGTIGAGIIAPYQMESQKRFSILYDKTHVLNPRTIGVAVDYVPIALYFKKKIPLSRVVKYDGSAASLSDIVTNSLILTAMSDQDVSSPTMTFGTRFIYKDL